MSQTILNLDHIKAKRFLLTQEAFTSIELPPYFSFQEVLVKTDKKFKQKELKKDEIKKAKYKETVNHILYGNKDGKYAWRKFQIINPLLYVSLVNVITDENNWKFLKNRFYAFQQSRNIRCESLPVLNSRKRKQKAAQISQWINSIEKKSVALSLEYKFLYHTDISDCYGAIYTHSVSWAIHSREEAKRKRNSDQLFGNKIDGHLQAMSNGQTNGIPQGSILMDFVAEIVLGYADLKLAEKIDRLLQKKKYYILRYRDDYRIFVNDINDGDIIFKALSETLSDLGFRLNTSKTFFNQDVVGGSFKEDKIDSLKYELVPKKLSKSEILRQLLIIQQIGKRFPNSGVITNRLSKILDAVKPADCAKQEHVLSGILSDIGYSNPNCFPLIAGLMSGYIWRLPKQNQINLLEGIREKICNLSNAGLLEIWIQRMALGMKHKLNFNEVLCKYVSDDHKVNIFPTDWITDRSIKRIIDNACYIDKSIFEDIKPKIDRKEIQIFTYTN